MKKLIAYLNILILYGCNAPGNLFPSSSSTDCPEKPLVTLNANDVQEISLDQQAITKSGQANANKSIGYKFAAKSGQKLSYKASSGVCVWVYSPNIQLISGGILPEDGNYIIQVSAPQGLKTFDLEMSLGVLEASATPTNSSSSLTTSTPSFTHTTAPENILSRPQAIKIVNQWLKAKPRIFAPPFDTDLVGDLTTGKLYQAMTSPNPENGRIAWLRSKGAYYTYARSEITNVISFSNSDNQPYIKVRVFEELYLHANNRIDPENSGLHHGNFIYFFANDNEVWKISNYYKIQ